VVGVTELIETAPHEFTANYNFADGLDPYFAFDAVAKQHNGSTTTRFDYNGEPWEVTLYYQDSGIVNPGEVTPYGTTFRLDELREFRLSVESARDSVGQRSFNVHIRPRWDGMTVEDDQGGEQQLNVPFDEGVNAKIAGSNIEFHEHLNLLQEAASALSIGRSYFTDPHDSSNVQQAERYVRLSKDESGPVHARDGPLARVGHLLESDRHGSRRTEQTDIDGRGEQSPGYRHQVGVDEVRIQEVWPNHALPKQMKHYYAREHKSMPSDHPLSHPKVGAIYYPTLWRDSDQKLGVSPSDLQQLTEELDETVLGILHDAGIPVTTTGPFVEDAYFDAELSDRQRQVVELPLQDIKERQESVVISNVADGMSPVEWEALEVLVTDGGKVAPTDIAESGDFHVDSVYRALDRIDQMIQREYGGVELRSSYVGELVHDAVTSAKERTRNAVEAGAKALAAAERGLDQRTSAFVAWASQHCESWRESEDGVAIDFGEVEADTLDDARQEIRRELREGKQLWDEMRNDEMKWRLGDWIARITYEKHPDSNYLSETTTETTGGPLFRALD
jgi:hypothetical protein